MLTLVKPSSQDSDVLDTGLVAKLGQRTPIHLHIDLRLYRSFTLDFENQAGQLIFQFRLDPAFFKKPRVYFSTYYNGRLETSLTTFDVDVQPCRDFIREGKQTVCVDKHKQCFAAWVGNEGRLLFTLDVRTRIRPSIRRVALFHVLNSTAIRANYAFRSDEQRKGAAYV